MIILRLFVKNNIIQRVVIYQLSEDSSLVTHNVQSVGQITRTGDRDLAE